MTMLILLPGKGAAERGGIQPLSDVNMEENTDCNRLTVRDGSIISEPSSYLSGPTGDLL
jgi:hypothetical protein